MLKNKTMTILIVLLLTVSVITPIILLPTTNAHLPTWTIVSYAYLSVAPNPVGIGQTVDVCMWVDTPMLGATIDNDIRRHNYTLTITDPEGIIQTQHWDAITDPTSVQFLRYTPTKVGTYTFKFDYGGQIYTWSGAYQNDTLTASNKTKTLTVQQDPIPMSIDSYPLPTEYWTRPIEGQNTYWYTIASNWLGTPYIRGANAARPAAYQPYGSAPNSAHVMWTKPIQFGGVVGGESTAVLGEAYYGGLSYNPRFTNPLIMQGTLFYREPWGNSGTGGDYVAVDLRTGQEQWRINTTATGISLVPSFGYLYSMDQPNQHGILPNGLLIATTTVTGQGTVWRGYDPRSGVLTTMNVTNVPTGTPVAGPSGEYLKYILTNYGTPTKPNWYLAEWNSSKVFGVYLGTDTSYWYSGTENASLPSAYDWNVSLSLAQGTWSIGAAGRGEIPLISLGNKALLIQGTLGGHLSESGATVSTDPANITAISLKPDTLGNVLWTKSYPQAPGNNSRYIEDWDPNIGVFIFHDKEVFERWGYSLTDGSLLWGPTVLGNDTTLDWNFLLDGMDRVAYGNLYFTGYSGILYCYNASNGKLQWTYGNGGPGNSTDSGFITPYGRYPEFFAGIADGKIYIVMDEHSPNSPMYKGGKLRAINATDGTELWTIFGWGNMMNGVNSAIADGYLATLNIYDMQIYSFGKGPSTTSINIQNNVLSQGGSVLIEGSVIDIAAGTKQPEQAARFPAGVPVVSDQSQTGWMEYVYMQKPRPTDTIGVGVTLTAVDPNGNFRTIGTANTDQSGKYSLLWQPDVPGKYKVTASFGGTESYWSSYSEAAFGVTAAAPTPSPYPVVSLPPTEMYILGVGAAIIVAIAIVGVVILLAVRRRP